MRLSYLQPPSRRSYLIREIVLTYLNQAVFHLENGEFITYSLDNGDADGYIKKADASSYEVVVRPKYDNGYYVFDAVKDVQGLVKNLMKKKARLVVHPGAKLKVMHYSSLQIIMNTVMGFFFRKKDSVQEIFSEIPSEEVDS